MCQPGRPSPHGRGPVGVLALLVRLPQREIQRVLLALGALDPLALVHVLELAMGEAAVVVVGAHAEVDVALDAVGMTAIDQRLDVVDDRPIVSEASGSWSGRPRPSASVSAL